MFGSDMGKALLVLLHTLWAVPSNAAEVLSIGDGDTLTVKEGNLRTKVRLACKEGSVSGLLHESGQQRKRAVEPGDSPVRRTPDFAGLDQAGVDR